MGKTKKSKYKCRGCKAKGVKLWHEYPVSYGLYCCDCAAATWKKDISQMWEDGTLPSKYGDGRTDQIDWHVPGFARETWELELWNTKALPPIGYGAWKALPLRIVGQ